MTPELGERSILAAELDALHQRGQRAHKGRITKRAWPRAIEAGLIASLALPIALALMLVLAQLGGPEPRDLGFSWAVLGMLLISGLVVGTKLWLARQRTIERAEIFGECDRLLDTGGRLLAADDFVRTQVGGPFVHAALEEGRHALVRARELRFPAADGIAPVRARAWVVAIIALRIAWLVTSGTPQPVEQLADADLGTVPGTTTTTERETTQQPTDLEQAPPPEVRPEPRSKPATRGERAESAQDGTPPSDRVKDSKGRTKGGRSSAAKSASGSGASRGAPSSQSQESSESEEASAKPGKRPKEGKQEDPDDERKQEEDASGATAGRGSGSGSTKNPSTSDWASKDHIEAQPDDEQGEDADVDDEDSDSEARGGVQPSLRDRRPPVNRDLQIGFGAGRPDPDANGRGGPSPQKKSRGVASLVLGVPIPDHIKGRANPGRTKVTQERVEPEAEDSVPVAAQARRARENSPGTIQRHELAPWMRELVRNYFERAPVAGENDE